MADLYKHDEEMREDWLKWAIEFAKRGIWPEDYITVHGPHSPYDYMWGEMGGYEFRTCGGIHGIHDVRGVRIHERVCGETVRYPVLPDRDLEPKLRKWLRAAQRTLATLRAERKSAPEGKRIYAERWERIRPERAERIGPFDIGSVTRCGVPLYPRTKPK
jgi:hypothetical protein